MCPQAFGQRSLYSRQVIFEDLGSNKVIYVFRQGFYIAIRILGERDFTWIALREETTLWHIIQGSGKTHYNLGNRNCWRCALRHLLVYCKLNSKQSFEQY